MLDAGREEGCDQVYADGELVFHRSSIGMRVVERRKLTLTIRGVRADLVLQVTLAREEHVVLVCGRHVVVAADDVVDATLLARGPRFADNGERGTQTDFWQ